MSEASSDNSLLPRDGGLRLRLTHPCFPVPDEAIGDYELPGDVGRHHHPIHPAGQNLRVESTSPRYRPHQIDCHERQADPRRMGRPHDRGPMRRPGRIRSPQAGADQHGGDGNSGYADHRCHGVDVAARCQFIGLRGDRVSREQAGWHQRSGNEQQNGQAGLAGSPRAGAPAPKQHNWPPISGRPIS
jgi:hypothetical protein